MRASADGSCELAPGPCGTCVNAHLVLREESGTWLIQGMKKKKEWERAKSRFAMLYFRGSFIPSCATISSTPLSSPTPLTHRITFRGPIVRGHGSLNATRGSLGGTNDARALGAINWE